MITSVSYDCLELWKLSSLGDWFCAEVILGRSGGGGGGDREELKRENHVWRYPRLIHSTTLIESSTDMNS